VTISPVVSEILKLSVGSLIENKVSPDFPISISVAWIVTTDVAMVTFSSNVISFGVDERNSGL